jgi:hypothetical protein
MLGIDYVSAYHMPGQDKGDIFQYYFLDVSVFFEGLLKERINSKSS